MSPFFRVFVSLKRDGEQRKKTYKIFLRARHLLCGWQYFILCQNSMAATKQICSGAEFPLRFFFFLTSVWSDATDKGIFFRFLMEASTKKSNVQFSNKWTSFFFLKSNDVKSLVSFFELTVEDDKLINKLWRLIIGGFLRGIFVDKKRAYENKKIRI